MRNPDTAPLPTIRKFPPTPLDETLSTILAARSLYNQIRRHQTDFRMNVARKGPATKLRNFEPTDPLDEWMDVTDASLLDLATLEKQGLIATIKVGDRYYSRTAS